MPPSAKPDIPAIMQRRHFLHAATGALALSPHASPAVPGRPSLGFSLYGMKTLPLEAALRTCAAIGYQHVEFALNAGYPTEPSSFPAEARKLTMAQLQDLNLSLPCLMINLSLTANAQAQAEALPFLAAAAAMAHDLAPENPPLLETVLGGKPNSWDQQKAGMVENLRAWAAAAEAAKIVIALKAHVGSAVNSPERLLWLLEQVPSPSLQVAYDYSHFQLQGIGMEESMKLLLPRARFIHVKDAAGDPGKFQFLLPGEGTTDYRKYFSLLKEHAYTGPVCVEVSGQIFNQPGYDPVAAAKKSFATLSGALSQVG